MRQAITAVLSLAILAVLPSASVNAADVELYAPMKVDAARQQTLEWIATRGVTDQELLEQAGALWVDIDEGMSAAQLQDLTIQTFAVIDAELRQTFARARLVNGPLIPPSVDNIVEKDPSPFFQQQVLAWYGRYLVQRRMYDEGLELLDRVEPAAAIDPASALFHRAVCEHQLLMKPEALKSLDRLLKDTEDVPVAYSTVAVLMQDELKNLKNKSLDEVTRMMNDVERRLDLGRGGEAVQKKEQEIVAALDEMIKKIEQSQGGGGGGGSAGGGNQSNGPAGDSNVGGQQAPGNVDNRSVGNDGGWGALPPKEQAKAKQDIARKFPPQYIEAINRYNRKLSNRRANTGR